MSLARALTKRYRPGNQDDMPSLTPARAKSHRYGMAPIDRAQISLPTELISTTNALAYTAPNLQDIVTNSSASSTRSYSDSDRSPTFSTTSDASTPQTSRETSPITSVGPGHPPFYYQARSSVDSEKSNTSSDVDAPAIPSRALSHTKKTHQILARKRSVSQIPILQQGTALPPTTIRTSIDMLSNKLEGHPFGAELAQVNELAEEFGSKNGRIFDEEEQYLMENGLQKFGAADYMMEIQGLFGGVFDDRSFPMSAGWI